MAYKTSILKFLKEKNIVRVGAAYIVGGWLLLQFGEVLIELMDLPAWFGRALIALLSLGFPFVLLMAWVLDNSVQADVESFTGADLNSSSTRKGKMWDGLVVLLFFIAFGLLAWIYDPETEERNIALIGSSTQLEDLTRKLDGSKADSDYLLVGNLVDFTGATGKSGEAWGQAIIDTANWVNENGGVAGKLFDLDTIETSYLVRRALPAFEKWQTQDVVAIQGFGTNIGLALRDKVSQNKIPYFSSAMAASFTAPMGSPGLASPAPYSFFYGPSYSDACRGLLEWAKEDWKKKGSIVRPTYVHMGDSHPYPDSPKAACEEYARELNFEVLPAIVFSLIPEDFSRQCQMLSSKGVNYAFLANLDKSVSSLLRQCSMIELKTQFMANVWGFDENVMKEAGFAANGVVWVMGATHWNDNVAGMYTVRQISMMSDPEQSKYRTTHYIRGVCSMFLLKEAIEIASDSGSINGPQIKNAMYVKRGWVPLGLEGVCRPATWSEGDHRGVNEVLIYQADISQSTQGKSLEELFSLQSMSMDHVFTAEIPRRQEWLGF